MKKFIYNNLLICIIILFGYILISHEVNRPKGKNDYMAAIIDKHNRIQAINGPKIILAGGSNLAFGINSQRLQNEFSVPIVNLGLHAGLGLDFIINELKASINDRDIVILSIEYFLGVGIYKLQRYTQSLYPKASSYYNNNIISDILDHIENTRTNLKKINLIRPIDTSFLVYSRNSFNEYGDVVAHLEQTSKKKLTGQKVFSYKFWTGIEILNEFHKYSKEKNVKVFFMYPNFPKSFYNKNNIVFENLHRDLKKNLSIEILNCPSDFVFNDSLFYDTNYHLNRDGRELRTNKFIEIINKSTNAQQCINAIRAKSLF